MFGRCSHGQTTVLYLTRNEEAALGLQAILKQKYDRRRSKLRNC